MRRVALAVMAILLAISVAGNAFGQTNAIYPYAAGSDTTFTGFAYVPRTFDLTQPPILEVVVTAVPDTISVDGFSRLAVVGDGDLYTWYFINGSTVLGVDRPSHIVVNGLGGGTYVVVTGR